MLFCRLLDSYNLYTHSTSSCNALSSLSAARLFLAFLLVYGTALNVDLYYSYYPNKPILSIYDTYSLCTIYKEVDKSLDPA
jgi:hypothetical protein